MAIYILCRYYIWRQPTNLAPPLNYNSISGFGLRVFDDDDFFDFDDEDFDFDDEDFDFDLSPLSSVPFDELELDFFFPFLVDEDDDCSRFCFKQILA